MIATSGDRALIHLHRRSQLHLQPREPRCPLELLRSKSSRTCEDTTDIQLAFFYFSFSDIEKQGPYTLLSSVVSRRYYRLQQIYDRYYLWEWPFRQSSSMLKGNHRRIRARSCCERVLQWHIQLLTNGLISSDEMILDWHSHFRTISLCRSLNVKH